MAREQRQALVEAAAVDNDEAEILQRIRHVRPQRQRAPVRRLGLLQLALLVEDIAEIAVRRREIRRNGADALEHRRRFIELALVLERNAKRVVGARMARPLAQNAAVELLGFADASGLVLTHGLLQRGVELGRLRSGRHHTSSQSERKQRADDRHFPDRAKACGADALSVRRPRKPWLPATPNSIP